MRPRSQLARAALLLPLVLDLTRGAELRGFKTNAPAEVSAAACAAATATAVFLAATSDLDPVY
jgi:hypothetical protein